MDSLRASEVFKVSAFKLIAVESVDLRQSRTKTGCRLHGKIEPVAVIVCSTDGTYALDMEAQAVDVDRLKQATPGLDSIMRPFDHDDRGL